MSTTWQRFRRGFKHRWPLIKKILVGAIILITLTLIVNLGRQVDWPAVLQAARQIDSATIALAALMAVAGYLTYASFDLLSRHYAGHDLPTAKVLGVAAISYALNQNLGVLLGGVAVRLRLYDKLGLRQSQVGRVVLFSSTTNWVGYGWLGGAVFLSGLVPTPQGWDIGQGVLRAIGAGILAISAGYVALCAWYPRRDIMVRGHRLILPTGRMAALQSVLAMLSWSLMGGIIHVLLQGAVPYPAVLGVLLCCSIAAVITHVPGGLGTTEAIFVAALSSQLPTHTILGAVLMYRAVYALAPLCLGLLAYLVVEARFAQLARR